MVRSSKEASSHSVHTSKDLTREDAQGQCLGKFSNNIENIKDLIRLVARYLTRSDGRKQFTISLFIKEEEKTWEVFGYVP